ncbi:transcriptional regulator [Intrasporangium oryzae NRRL B-24470]|uniref:Transcriptional regulator n=1 Tax=Intrasporangium oryzae NRRL B-24470 TaxID=1386089 RepID=W9G8D2_9MICO|nr:MerR family transcriptional regulator [Intrasporangium oryzae]EWT02471.1 transcriptional regulator [Intrasporangium oryzae NRRL B-24470]
MYTIKRAAELTGISVATLRAWERRYGVVHPQRTEGGYRLYGPDDVRALAIMNSLVNEGWSAREAAQETLVRLSGERRAAPADAEVATIDRSELMGGAVAPVVSLLATRHTQADSDDAEAFVRAAERLDAAAAASVLDARFALGTFEHVVDSWLMPTLSRVGEAWAEGRLTVAGEHLVSYAVQRRLAAAYEAASGRVDGPTVIIGLPPGSRHELGLLAFAVAARRAGLATVYVGADLPVEDWVTAMEARQAGGVVMAVPRLIDIPPAESIVRHLRAAEPEVVIGVGGRFQDSLEDGCVPLGHSIAGGVAVLSRLLRIPA